MPGGDRTGPLGISAMSGRGSGFCAGSAAPGFGRGMGRGMGGGRGHRHRYLATGQPGWSRVSAAPERELAALKQQADYFGKTLEDIQGRIRELESTPDAK